MPAPLPPTVRMRLFVLGGLALLVVAAVLFFATSRSTRERPILADFALTAPDYSGAGLRPGEIAPDQRSTPLLLRYEAPVDQSWVFLECKLIDANDRPAAEFYVQLEYYHGTLDGERWEKGSGRGEQMIHVTGPGPYRLWVKGSGGFGDEAPAEGAPPNGPPVRLQVLEGIRTTHALTWATVLAFLGAVALLLRAVPPPAPGKPGPGVTKPRLLFLDGLRGVAVIAVLLCHFVVPEISHLAVPLREALGETVVSLVGHGDLGVEIFFVLSGFVISYTVVGRDVTPSFTGRFVARRAVRLDPPYYIALLLMLTVVAMEHHDGLAGAWRQFGGWETALINMFYLQDLLHRPTPLDISWSLCLEIQFYLAFILICYLASLLRRLAGRAAGDSAGRLHTALQLALVLLLMAVSLWCWYPGIDRFDFFGTWFRFGLGVLTCWVFTKRISPLWLYGALAAVALPSLVWHDLRGAAAVGTAGLIHYAGHAGRLATWLSGRTIQFFGRISYSMYLIHLAAGIFVANLIWEALPPTPGNALLLVPVGIGAAILGSVLIHALFERPSVALSQRIKKAAPPRAARSRDDRPTETPP